MRQYGKTSAWVWALLVLLFGFKPSAAAGIQRGGELIHIYQRFPAHFNVAIRPLPEIAVPAANIFIYLVRLNDRQQPVPYLADSWETTDDGRTVTFHLKPGTLFHDGYPVTSKDVVFSIETVRAHHPFGDDMFGPVSGLEAPNPHTVVIRLNRPHSVLLKSLACPLTPILPRHVYGGGDIRANPANRYAVGSGPFKVSQFEPGRRFVLERFEGFLIPQRPYLDRYIGVKLDDTTAISDALMESRAHMISFVDNPTLVNNLLNLPDLTITAAGYAGLGAVNRLEFNLRKKLFQDIRVREAISAAIDLDEIIQTLHQGLSRKAIGPLPASSPFYPRGLDPNRTDPAAAEQLLDEAGYPRDASGLRFHTTLIWNPNDPVAQKKLAALIRSQLARVGIGVELIEPRHLVDFSIRLAKWEFDMALSMTYSWGDPAIGLHRLFSSKTIEHQRWANTAGFVNEDADRFLEAAAAEADFEQRFNLYLTFQHILAENLPSIFLHEGAFYTIYHRDFKHIAPGWWGVVGPFDQTYRQPNSVSWPDNGVPAAGDR